MPNSYLIHVVKSLHHVRCPITDSTSNLESEVKISTYHIGVFPLSQFCLDKLKTYLSPIFSIFSIGTIEALELLFTPLRPKHV